MSVAARLRLLERRLLGKPEPPDLAALTEQATRVLNEADEVVPADLRTAIRDRRLIFTATRIVRRIGDQLLVVTILPNHREDGPACPSARASCACWSSNSSAAAAPTARTGRCLCSMSPGGRSRRGTIARASSEQRAPRPTRPSTR